jgi:hypothetical protein
MFTVCRCKTVMLSQRAGNGGAAIAVFVRSASCVTNAMSDRPAVSDVRRG